MPVFDETTQDKIVELRGLKALGVGIEVYQLVQIDWPSPDGTIYYAVMPTDEVASVVPPVSPIEMRIIPDSNPDWFLPQVSDATIGDEEIDVEMWDADEVFSNLLVDHGEGIKATVHYWFPQVELMIETWHGHIRNEDESTVEKLTLKIVQGFRSADAIVPSRAHYQYCMAIFGGLLTTQGEIDDHDCPYNLHIGGAVGIDNPATTDPWTYCDRLDRQSCIDRGVDPNYHLSHATMTASVQNNQTHGPNLTSISEGNENNLKDPVRVVMGTRRISGGPTIAFRRDLNSNNPHHGWFYAYYEMCEGPIEQIAGARITVGGEEQNAVAMHYNYRLGTKGQTPMGGLTVHAYNGTAYIVYNFGYVEPNDVAAADASASAVITGLNDIRIYSDAETYTTDTTSNRAWQIARILTDKRWGFGYDYARLNIDSFIEAADWCEQGVTFTDTFGTDWSHVRSDSHVELIGKKVQQQIEDMCMAGRLSKPFLFNGQIHIMPLRELTEDELAACPVFYDSGDEDGNIVWEDGVSTLTISRDSDLDLVNRVKCLYDSRIEDYAQTPLRPVEDIDAQLRAGRVVGDKARKINPKEHSLLGVVDEAQAIKMAWSILDLGPNDEGGLQNNCRITFRAWFTEVLDLHQDRVIKVVSSRLTKYGFTYFRVKKIEAQGDLQYEIECQAYNETYMAAFETDITPPPDILCAIDSDCPEGYDCINGVCVRQPIDPPCRISFGTITYSDGAITMVPEPCE